MNSRKQRRRTAGKGAGALDRRPQISYHEAAHAVIARKLGQSCLGIMMFPTDSQSNAGALTSSAAYHSGGTVEERIEGLKCDARVSLAGPIANVLHSGREELLYDGTGGDFEHARNAALSIVLLMAGHPLPQHECAFQIEVDIVVIEQADSILSAIMAETKSLVSENWSAIERVAKVLLTADLVTEVELDGLIARSESQSSSG
jgi:ATP-dependent Zn protease